MKKLATFLILLLVFFVKILIFYFMFKILIF